jgi:putative ABC transport system permease protein
MDLRYALRNMLRTPAFTLSAVMTLALGIGANSALFSIVNAVLLRPLPYQDPDPLVMLWEHNLRLGRDRNVVAPADYLDWKQRARSLAEMTALSSLRSTLTGAGDPEELRVERTTESYFRLLGAQPLRGRTYSETEDKPGAPPVAVVSYSLWMRKFGGDAALVGKSIRLDGQPTTVIGIMPPNFVPLNSAVDVWFPLALNPAVNYRERAGRYLLSAARLKPGVTLDQAQKELRDIAAALAVEYPKFNTGWSTNIVPMHEQVTGPVRLPLLVLMGAVAFLLLIACANVANLLLARASGRRREMAVRVSLGATRSRVVRQLLTESLLLAVTGAAVGWLLAWAGVAGLKTAGDALLPRASEVQLNWMTLVFTTGVALVCGVLFGLAPALDLSAFSLTSHLQEGGRSGIGGRHSSRLRSGLIVAEVALSVVLLVGAGLMLKSFRKLIDVNPGFDPQNVVTMQVSLANARYRENPSRVAFFKEAVEAMSRVPGVQDAAYVMGLPLSGPGSATRFYDAAKPTPEPGQFPVTDVRIAHPNYFKTMRIPLLQGRVFDEHDLRMDAPMRFIVSDTLAQRIFPGQNALGQKLVVNMGDETPGEIIGVVATVKTASLEETARPMVYYPHSRLPFGSTTFVVRTPLPAAQIIPSLTRVIRDKDPELPVSEIKPMEAWLERSVARPRLQMMLLGGMAVLAIILAAVGIYGVMSFLVSLRTQEIGVRMALGATRAQVFQLILSRGGTMVLIGMSLGLAAAIAVTRVMETLLFQIETTDPATYMLVAALLTAVALIACLIPARHASTVDPLVALRNE